MARTRTTKQRKAVPPAVWSTEDFSGILPSPTVAAQENEYVRNAIAVRAMVLDLLEQDSTITEEHAEQLGFELIDEHDLELRVENAKTSAKEELFDEVKKEFEEEIRASVKRETIQKILDEVDDLGDELPASARRTVKDAIEAYVA